jgi:hypothetical protein
VTWKRIIPYLLTVPIALAVVGLLALYDKYGSFPWMPSVRWWGLAGMTALLGWTMIKGYRRFWRRPAYWLVVSGSLTIHWIAWALVLRNAQEWGLLWFVPPVVAEAALNVVLLHALGFDPSDP